MAVGGLYNLPDASGRALGAQSAVATTTANMDKAVGVPKKEKTVGGAMQSAAGGAIAGAAFGGWGAVVGGVAGLAMYYM